MKTKQESSARLADVYFVVESEREFYQNWMDDISTFKEEERTVLKTFLSREHVLALLNSIDRKN